MKNRIISLLILGAMLISAVACAESADETTKNAESSADIVTEEASGETLRSEIKDGLPNDLKFNGANFTILDRDDGREHFSEEGSGDVVKDAIYNRNLRVSERLDVNYDVLIRNTWQNYASEISQIRRDISSGDESYQMVNGYSIHIVTLMTENLFYELSGMKYLDFSQPWWAKSIIDEMTINNHLFFASGDINYTTLYKQLVVYINKRTQEIYNIPDIYNMVDEGTWTFDQLAGLAKAIYNDENGNGKYDDNDVYGLVMTPYNSVDGFLAAFHQDVTALDEEGYPQLCLKSEKMVDIVNKIYSLCYENEGVHIPRNTTEDSATMTAMFKNDQVVFMPFFLEITGDNLRDMDANYGIVPYPKYNEEQEGYGTYLQDGHSLVCIPSYVQDTDMVSAVIEALCAEGYRTVTPAYFDVALSTKYARDEESVRMLQLIRDSIKYNFGYVYCLDAFWAPRNLMNQSSKGSNNFSSYYDKNEKKWNRSLTKMNEKFAETYDN